MFSTYLTYEEKNLFLFSGEGIVTSNTASYKEYTWIKPGNCNGFYFLVMSSGAPGTPGSTRAINTAGSGGIGGMPSQIYTGFFPYFFVPEILYIRVSGNTRYPTTSVTTGLYYDAAYTAPFLEIKGGNTATSYTTLPGNTTSIPLTGATGATASYPNWMYSGHTLYSNSESQPILPYSGTAPNGRSGNTLHYSVLGAGGCAKDLTLALSYASQDGANAGITGAITSVILPPTPTGGTPSFANGANGWTIFEPTFISIGGAGGASINNGVGGNGGDGGFGSGGGGSGSGTTAGTPGMGGPGLILIKGI